MASEALRIPEEHLAEVIGVIQAGLKGFPVSYKVNCYLKKWCAEMQEYLDENGE